MGLSGLQIYKLLPKTNCKECGFPTCLAFAMKLAAKQVSLDKCPHVSEEAKAQMGSASQPPIRLVTIGTGETKLELGNETVLFRHEETFYHETGLAILLRENDPEAEKRLRRTGLAILPVGSLEQHGPHLPLDTDSWDAYHLSQEAVRLVKGEKPLILPLIPYYTPKPC